MTCVSQRECPLPLRWGVVGPGAIADVFATSLAQSGIGTIAANCARRDEAARAFTSQHGGMATTDLEELLETPDMDAVYIATPHSAHREVAIAALDAGLPVLCEKPMSCAPADTAAIIDAAQRSTTPLIEGWMYRWHPQIELLVDLVRTEAVGPIEHVEATFGFEAKVKPKHRLRNPALGGGAILDVGGYPMSIALLVAQAIDPAVEITTIDASGTLDMTGVDADARCSVTFSSGVTASLHASIVEEAGMSLRCIGSRGVIDLPCPFLPGSTRTGVRGEVRVTVAQVTRTSNPVSAMDCFSLEAAAMSHLISKARTIEPAFPAVDHRASRVLATALDDWISDVRAKEHAT